MRRPAIPVRSRRHVDAGLIAAVMCALGLTPPAGARAHGAVSLTSTSTVSGTLRDAAGPSLAGMRIEAVPAGSAGCAVGCVSTDTAPGGAFTLTGLTAGSYAIDVVDGLATVTVRSLTVTGGATGTPDPLVLTLGPASVPAATSAIHARQALAWLNAERRRARVPAGVVLNPRWSLECAAHDRYEQLNATLAAGEDPTAAGYSAGGAWAGLSSDLAQGDWTAAASPWRDAPVSLLALLAPSLSVTGIDDSAARQCAVSFPGMLRRPPPHDTIHTVPAAGARGVPTSEIARESPYTPVHFIGLPATARTGPELFVYLNRTGETGQAPVTVTAATLRHAGHAVPVRWVDATTPTLGPDLAGAILIPLSALTPGARYRASVSIRDGPATVTRTWSFTTADPAAPGGQAGQSS